MPSQPENTPAPRNRRQFLRDGARIAAMTGVGALLGVVANKATARSTVWQIDPQKCVRCGNCATHCVLEQSAVKCVHAYAMCGYCQLCTGYFEPEPNDLNTGAENCLCPTAAIKRTYVEDPYYEYTIDERLCIGCAKCVEGCTRFGNGSLFLQVRHPMRMPEQLLLPIPHRQFRTRTALEQMGTKHHLQRVHHGKVQSPRLDRLFYPGAEMEHFHEMENIGVPSLPVRKTNQAFEDFLLDRDRKE